jgi:hypothetical protein
MFCETQSFHGDEYEELPHIFWNVTRNAFIFMAEQ